MDLDKSFEKNFPVEAETTDKTIEQQEYFEDNDDIPEVEFTTEDYNKWLEEQKQIADIEFSEFEKFKNKTFDEIVIKYSILIGLRGASYIDATKLVFYSVLANQIKLNSFSMESKDIDLRINILMQLKAGHGKKNYEYFIRKTIERLNKSYQEPTSYHPEQFVGKILVKDTKEGYEYQPVYGTLSADYLMIDEAHALLTMEKNEECLKYMRTALDPIGYNRIEKKQVNVPDSEKLMYNPICTVMLLTQPITNINEELLIRGSFRRFIILFLQTTFEERIQARRDSKFLTVNESIHDKIWASWIELNKKLDQYKNLKYICPDFSRIDDYLDDLAVNARQTSPEVLEFFNTSQFTIKQNIFKMAIVRAVIEHTEGNTITIQKSHINAAIKDWHTLWIPQVRWIAQQMSINSLNPLRWDENKHGVIVKILQKNDNILVKDLVTRYMEKMGIQIRVTAQKQVMKILNDLKQWDAIGKTPSGVKNGVLVFLKDKNISKK